MNLSSVIGLVNNAALLIALGLLYEMLGTGKERVKPTVQEFVSGAVLGVIGMAIMLNPWEFKPGVVFDTRSVLLGISGLFWGLVPTSVAVLMTGTFRLWMGGAGAWTGVAVIGASACIGLLWRYFRSNREENLSTGELYVFGMVVHVAMLLCMFSLPWTTAMGVLSKISLPVMLIYPAATALLGWLMVNRGCADALRRRYKKAKQSLETW